MSSELQNSLFQTPLQQQIAQLELQELEELFSWLKITLKARKQALVLQEIPLKKGREVVETLNLAPGTTYRLEKVKCGKKKCKCNQGKLHGPYWYAYSWSGKKLTSTYIGKKLSQPSEQFLEPVSESNALPPAPPPVLEV
jgi:hypothetical protein